MRQQNIFWILTALFILGLAPSSSVSASTFKPEPALVRKGKTVFESKGCTGCHSIGNGNLSGPDLKGLFDRREQSWVKQWIKDPESLFATNDPAAKDMLAKFMTKMPTLGLTDEEAECAMHYIAEQDKAPRNQAGIAAQKK